MHVDLQGKTVLVTGSVKGLGYGIAMEAGKCGANVVMHYRSSSAESVQRAADALKATGCRSITVQADLAAPNGPESLYAAACEAFGGVDVLVNNAAMQHNVNFGRYDTAMFRQIFRVNLRGYTQMIRLVCPRMKKNRFGRVINISSIHAERPTNFDFGYSATKGAIRMLTREMAMEVMGDGITVNALELGYVEVGDKSGNPPRIVEPKDMELPHLFTFRGASPTGRTIMPEDVGPIVMMLASDEMRFINGTSIRLDDGASLL